MFHIPLQALSINQAHAGKRYKSNLYRQYQQDVNLYLATLDLPKIEPKKPFFVYYVFGIPRLQDCTNGIKLFEDLLADHLGVNDRDAMMVVAEKIVTKKSDCFIQFDIFNTRHELLHAITNGEAPVV